MTTDETTRIEVEVVEDGARVVARFEWEHAKYALGAQASINDGHISLHLHTDDARELQRQLGEALDKQDFADAGHPAFERVQEEADVRREEIEEPA